MAEGWSENIILPYKNVAEHFVTGLLQTIVFVKFPLLIILFWLF